MKTLLNNIKDRDYASENEKNVIDIFRKALEKHFNNEWTIIHNAFIPLINGEHMEIDLIIAKNNYPVAIVEIKPSLKSKFNVLQLAKAQKPTDFTLFGMTISVKL